MRNTSVDGRRKYDIERYIIILKHTAIAYFKTLTQHADIGTEYLSNVSLGNYHYTHLFVSSNQVSTLVSEYTSVHI
jgi:hypothetical protein